MCLHVLGMIGQTLLFANTQLDCKKAKCMKKVKGVTKIAFLQSNNMAVNPSMFYE